jgi:hypothetical protein
MEGKMSKNLYNLYNYNPKSDRRQQNNAVSIDMRSGEERRSPSRPVIDTKLDYDIERTKQIFAPFLNNDDSFIKQINRYDSATKEKTDKEKETTLGTLSTIPYVRRFTGVEDAIQNHDNLKALGKALVLLINIPEDTRDIKDAGKQLVHLAKKVPPEIPYDYQTKFSFFRGILLEPLLKKLIESKNEKISNFGYKIYYSDKSLYDIQFGQKIKKLLNITEDDAKYTKRIDIEENYIRTFKLGGKFFPKLIGRAMLRIPVISILVFATLEIPSIIKAFLKKQDDWQQNVINGTKQIFKSAINVISVISGGAILGALFAKKGYIGSLIGLGVGTYYGSKAGNYINKKTDEIF